jgi:hypothetical protein
LIDHNPVRNYTTPVCFTVTLFSFLGVKSCRQAITSAGSGCMAALDAERFLGE